jgi:hypothetical protein
MVINKEAMIKIAPDGTIEVEYDQAKQFLSDLYAHITFRL